MQIPNEAMHASFVGKWLWVANPVHGQRDGVRIRPKQFVIACEAAHQLSSGVEDFELNWRRRLFFQVKIENSAVGRIFGQWFVHRDGRALIVAGTDAVSSLRSEEPGVARFELRIDLPQWRDIVQNPEGAAEGGNH